MSKFIYQVIIYIISFVISLNALSSLDFSRFLKKNKTFEAQVLYLLIALALTYLVGSLFIELIYYFHI